jgi:hypothetical protein
MNPKRGVVERCARSAARRPENVSASDPASTVLGVPAFTVPSGTTLALHSALRSMIEWKYMNPLCRVAYCDRVTMS